MIRMRTLASLAIVSLLCGGAWASAAAAGSVPATIAAAVADDARPEADRARDPDRHPAEVLAFFGVEPGMPS